MRREGFVVTKLLRHYKDLPNIKDHPWQEFPFLSGCLLQVLFVLVAFVIEWLLSRKRISGTVGVMMHQLNAHATLLVPSVIVWQYVDAPLVGGFILIHATITWMKLLSYAHANQDYRINDYQAGLALIEGLDLEDENIQYPENVTLKNIFYFWCAPTLTYQIAFPRSPRVRVWKVAGILFRMMVAATLFSFLIAQVVSPALESLVHDLEATNGTYTAGILAEYWLKLALTNTYLWLIVFYFYFHLYLNLFAEILRFGDRVFYKDWWNSSEVSAYWRLWNMPVHYWLVRHVYFPCIRLRMSKMVATFVVFLVSAILHELLISVPFHMIRPW